MKNFSWIVAFLASFMWGTVVGALLDAPASYVVAGVGGVLIGVSTVVYNKK